MPEQTALDDLLAGLVEREQHLQERLIELELHQLPETSRVELYASFRGLPGLRGLWLPGSADNTGAVVDASGQQRTLAYNGNPTINLHNNLVPYYDLDGTGDWLSRATEAGLGLVGNETYIAPALRGATVFGWFWADVTGTQKLIAKQDGATQAGNNYVLYANGASLLPTFSVSSGAAGYSAAGSGLSISTWYFLVGRFVPSTSVSVFVNGVESSFATAIPATLNNPAQPFQIGAGNNTNPLNGRCALAGICAAALPNALLAYLFNRTRAQFGV